MGEWVWDALLRLHCGGRGLRGDHLEAQDDGPDQPQGQPVVPIHDVMGAHVLQVHTLLLQELQRLIHVFQRMDSHATARGPWLGRWGHWEMDDLT